jgi:uncharacterized membrane protein
MLGLSALGLFHTVIGLAALTTGVVALVKVNEIRVDDRFGRLYLLLTLVTAVTSLAIFRRGAFGPPHVLALMTLVALAIGYLAARSTVFGRASRYVAAACFTTTILFHLIPGVTETSIRLPVDRPFAASPESPALRPIYAGLLMAWAIGLALQLRWLRRRIGAQGAVTPARADA